MSSRDSSYSKRDAAQKERDEKMVMSPKDCLLPNLILRDPNRPVSKSKNPNIDETMDDSLGNGTFGDNIPSGPELQQHQRRRSVSMAGGRPNPGHRHKNSVSMTIPEGGLPALTGWKPTPAKDVEGTRRG
ncbi:hypothetical protein TWF481_007348 [Arthrobotrys musiformis]|uniref:Uncharacterized protein n=1 Tax=Arthrobotrys musiformis TaxID=47236 RepID=A0AAV9WBC8_9PEZI